MYFYRSSQHRTGVLCATAERISQVSNSSIGHQVAGRKRPHHARFADGTINKCTPRAVPDHFIPSGLAVNLEYLPQECLIQAQAQENLSYAGLE